MRVLKFGGSSVKDAECIRAVCQIVSERMTGMGSVAVVVSALGGVTDVLLGLAQGSEQAGAVDTKSLDQLCQRHLDTAVDLAPADTTPEPLVRGAFGDLAEALRGLALLGETSPRSLDRILSFGERLSSALVAAAMRVHGLDAEACDARQLIVTDAGFGAAKLDGERTQAKLLQHFDGATRLQVVAGFIAATLDGKTTTLGRGGSDTTASIIASALSAEALELWTDVDGVMSADPRIVPDAIPLPRMSYEELPSAGVSVVTANKRKLASPLAEYRALQQAAPGRLYYETTVGAGLPIVRTLRDLLATGDSPQRPEGVLSGTLSDLLAETATGTPLSEAIREAHKRGFTERYGDDPLVVRGPGAGHAVTAAGVFADILTAVAEDDGDWA